MTDSPPSPLALHRAHVSVEKRAAVIEICDLPATSSCLRSISSVARAANVSREFIHSHPDLHSRVVAAVDRSSRERRRAPEGDRSATSLRAAERTTLINAVTRAREAKQALEEEVSQLQSQRRRDLGAKLEALTAPTSTERMAEVALTERILAENSRLTRELLDATALISQLREDLVASRLALAQELSSAGGAVHLVDYRAE